MKFTYLEIMRLGSDNELTIICSICRDNLEIVTEFAHKIMLKCQNKKCPMIRLVLRKRELLENYSELIKLEKKKK